MNAQVDTQPNGTTVSTQPLAQARPAKPLVPVGSGAIEVFASAQNFEQAWRMSQAISQSDLVPDVYKGKPANVLLAMNAASRIGADIFAVMQNLDIIHGRPSWRGTFAIAAINASGRYGSPLRFDFSGEGMTRQCIAWTVPRGVVIPLNIRTLAQAREINLPVLESPVVSMAIVKAEGWFDRNGSKWKTMPDLMFHYRSGAFFSRVHCPDILLGMQTREEVEDTEIRDITPREPHTGVAGARALLGEPLQPTPPAIPAQPTVVNDDNTWINTARAQQSVEAVDKTWETCVSAYGGNVPLPVEDAFRMIRESLVDKAKAEASTKK